MNDTYLQLLEYLEEFGIDREVRVDHLLLDWFRNQPYVDVNEPLDSLYARIVHFVDEMHENRHIQVFHEPRTIDGDKVMYISARLTFFGKQYCIDQRQFVVNKTVADNSGIQATASQKQTTIFKWTAIFVFGTLVFSGISLWKDFHKDALEQQLSQKDSLIRTLQKNLYRLETAPSLQKMAKKKP